MLEHEGTVHDVVGRCGQRYRPQVAHDRLVEVTAFVHPEPQSVGVDVHTGEVVPDTVKIPCPHPAAPRIQDAHGAVPELAPHNTGEMGIHVSRIQN